MELQPDSSRALCHLGTGQLAEHDATGDQANLSEAELSFRASIAVEGQPITAETLPGQLTQQQWWKKKMQSKESEVEKKEEKKVTPTPTAGQKAPQKGGPPKQSAVGPRAPPAGRGRGGGGVAQPTATSRKPAGQAASRQPPRAGGRGGAAATTSRPGQTTRTPAAATGKPGGKNVATLGELKTGNAPANKTPATTSAASKTPTAAPSKATAAPSKSQESVKKDGNPPAPKKPVEVNQKTHHPRLGLARVLAKSSTSDKAKRDESCSLYQEVILMSPDLHDAYIELGEMLAKTDPVAAVDAYSRFPFSDPPSFNDAYLHGEIVRLLISSEGYDNPRLLTSLVAMGRALGIGVLEKQVSVLENKFKTDLLKKVYSGVHGKPVDDPDLQAFFKFKCWR